MNNPRVRFSLVLFSVALAAAAVAGQQSKPAQSGSRHIPCWKQVGISPSAMEQRKAIMEGAKTKMQSVCKDDSLTAQQKKEQLQQIHKEAAQQAEGLITPEQNEALKKCQHEQGATNSGTHPARTTGPCGEPLEPDDSTSPSNSPTAPSN
jgi:ABC-type sugar transport system substrate-binding protein